MTSDLSSPKYDHRDAVQDLAHAATQGVDTEFSQRARAAAVALDGMQQDPTLAIEIFQGWVEAGRTRGLDKIDHQAGPRITFEEISEAMHKSAQMADRLSHMRYCGILAMLLTMQQPVAN